MSDDVIRDWLDDAVKAATSARDSNEDDPKPRIYDIEEAISALRSARHLLERAMESKS